VFKKLSNAFNNLFFVFGDRYLRWFIVLVYSLCFDIFSCIWFVWLKKIVGGFKKGWGVLGVYFFGGAAG
jgi:hypothetical protein